MKNRAYRFILAFMLLIPCYAAGQDTVIVTEPIPRYDSLRLLYPFLDMNANHIMGDTASLRPFFGKLERIRDGSRERAVVVHIGDSHVQPGVFSMPLREWMQAEYGNSGRGIIFPYRLARSNGPAGYISHCDTPWVYSRNAAPKRLFTSGVAGFTLWSANTSPSFTIEFTAPVCNAGDTLSLRVFHGARDSCYAFRVSNELTGHVYTVTDSSHPCMTVFRLDDQPGKIRVRGIKTAESQHAATFYGMSLESARPGVIVHTIGVNGAMYSSYLSPEHFTEQLALLHPDLLVISLGTNEAFATKSYSAQTFRACIDSLVMQIRSRGIQAPVMLTTPPGIYQATRKKRHTTYKPSPVAADVSRVIREYAATNGMTYWDWYTIMGGLTGMAKWKARKMTDRRYIHFSGKGYGIQGVLLREAFIECRAKSIAPGKTNKTGP